MTVNDTESEGVRRRKGGKKEMEGEKRVLESKLWNGMGERTLPPKMKGVVIKSCVAIRDVKCPPAA